MIKNDNSNKKIEIWFQDEARVGQHGTLERVWARTGTRPRALQDMRFENAYIFGGICPGENKAEAIVMTKTGKKETEAHLEAISLRVSEGSHAVIIMDGAPWHKSLKTPQNITIVILPPYSPELNPSENVWDYIRSNFLSNRVYNTLESIIDACCDAWNAFTSIPGRIKSIGTREWATI